MLHDASDVAHPQRLSAFGYIGRHRYFVTFCTLNRRPLFVNADLVASVLSHFLEQGARFTCAIVAYCFMPDHVHLLIEGLADVRTCEPSWRSRNRNPASISQRVTAIDYRRGTTSACCAMRKCRRTSFDTF